MNKLHNDRNLFPFPGIPGTDFLALIIWSPCGVRFQSRPHAASEFICNNYVHYRTYLHTSDFRGETTYLLKGDHCFKPLFRFA